MNKSPNDLQIRNRLEFVQKEINRTIQTAVKFPYNRNMNETILRLKKLKSLYGRLWKISVQVNDRFSWTVCSVLTVYFSMTTVGLYWILMDIKFNRMETMWRESFPF